MNEPTVQDSRSLILASRIDHDIIPPVVYPEKPRAGSTSTGKLAALDSNVIHLHRAIHTRLGNELTLLCTSETARSVAYLLRLVTKTASHLSTIKTRRLSCLQHLRGGNFMSATLLILAKAATKSATRLEALTLMLDEWQIMIRMWGLLDTWMEAREIIKTYSEERRTNITSIGFTTAVSLVQTLSMASYHFWESTAWLSNKNVIRWSPEIQDKFLALSARSWAMCTLIEAGRLLVLGLCNRSDGKNTIDSEQSEEWRRDFIQNLAWALLALHWGFGNDLLPDVMANCLGAVPSIGYMKDLWKETA